MATKKVIKQTTTTKSKKPVIIELQDICKSYGKLNVLVNVNTKIYRGDRIGIIGPNGEGKTTISEIILRVKMPTSGKVIYANPNMRVGVQFQDSTYPRSVRVISMINYYVDAYKRHYRIISREKTVLLEGAKEAVEEASKIARLAIVTTKTAKYSKELMEYFELMHYFEVLIGREDVTHPKPDAEPINRALEVMNVTKSNSCWMLGDTWMDIASASAAGIQSIALLSGYESFEYSMETKACYQSAKEYMNSIIYSDVIYSIGGDEQRVHSISSQFSNEVFEVTMLPIWLSSFQYNNKQYNIAINGLTGEIAGNRPYSYSKIFITILLLVTLILGIIYLDEIIGNDRGATIETNFNKRFSLP